MKAKTSELHGAALDWAVAKCEGGEGLWYDGIATHWTRLDGKDRALSKGSAQSFTPSTEWSQGGPIIEREVISLCGLGPCGDDRSRNWAAGYGVATSSKNNQVGPTPLIAAMRCYVTSKLGVEIEIPKWLA